MLDAGCGTGRVTIRLSELGYDCVGFDLDASMLDVAGSRRLSCPGSRPTPRSSTPPCSASTPTSTS
ncbi:methyltransferase domain-containing protein [Streptomyces sp. KL116D]|uniref:methyltransferase domain-containing protein n=1 Tax=Streptomyces sp. KL116D TaxID=3045152 RepID=UPI003555F17F